MKKLSTQSSYIIGAYLNSTVGISAILYRNFSTTQASNGASIKMAMSAIVNTTAFLSALSDVWRIKVGRIGVLTVQESLNTLQTTYTSSVMNSRIFVYEIVVAPDIEDDSVRPIDLLSAYTKDYSQKDMLYASMNNYITFYTETIREIISAKPKPRLLISAESVSHDSTSIKVSMWDQSILYGIMLPNPTNRPQSQQVIKGLDANNKAVVSQSYVSILSDASGVGYLSFTLLNDNTNYTVFVSAECVLPFTPRLALNDSEVLELQVTTKVNLNLMKNS